MSVNDLKVVNRHHNPPDSPRKFYVGRGTPLGNIFQISELWTRQTVIKYYKQWLNHKIKEQDPDVLGMLNRIGALVLDGSGEPVLLECSCKPQPCHGDVIREVILNQIKAIKDENSSTDAGNIQPEHKES